MNSGMVQIQRAASISTAAAIAERRMENFRAIKFTAIGLADTAVAAADATYAVRCRLLGLHRRQPAQAAITASGTTLTVASATGFPTAAALPDLDRQRGAVGDGRR